MAHVLQASEEKYGYNQKAYPHPAPKTQLQCKHGHKLYKNVTPKLQDQTLGDV